VSMRDMVKRKLARKRQKSEPFDVVAFNRENEKNGFQVDVPRDGHVSTTKVYGDFEKWKNEGRS
jgi:hypothetical protein